MIFEKKTVVKTLKFNTEHVFNFDNNDFEKWIVFFYKVDKKQILCFCTLTFEI